MVTVKMIGDLELKELHIDPEAVDPDDVELLQDMVQAAVNEAIRSAQELAASRMGAAAGGRRPAVWGCRVSKRCPPVQMGLLPGCRGSSAKTGRHSTFKPENSSVVEDLIWVEGPYGELPLQ
jgi:YbaB/EbfC DNA-binding family